MSRKNVNGFPRRRSSSLRERLFVSRERKTNQSSRARIQSTGALKGDPDLKAPLTIKYKFLREMSVRVYTQDTVSRNPWERLINSTRFPWSWDTYAIVLGDREIYSPTAVGIFTVPISYINIEDWTAVSIPRLPFSYIKLRTSDASYLIQAPDTYQRDRLLYSVQWKINVCKYEKILYSTMQPDVLIKELESLVKLTMEGPLYLDDTNHTLLDLVSNLLTQNQDALNAVSNEALIATLAPLFEENQPSIEICNFFTKHCRACPRSRIVIDMFMPVVMRILKYNTSYGRNLWLRLFVKEYILALSVQNDGEAAIRAFVQTIHGPLSVCPHKRILNNLFAVCLSAIYDSFSPPGEKEKWHKGPLKKKSSSTSSINDENQDPKLPLTLPDPVWEAQIAKYSRNRTANHHANNVLAQATDGVVPKSLEPHLGEYVSHKDRKLQKLAAKPEWTPDPTTAIVFARVLGEISTISDWLPGLAVLLQPVPFQTEAMQDQRLVKLFVMILERILASGNDDAIWCLVSFREHKDGWLQIFSPQSNLYQDDGAMFTNIARALLQSAKALHKVKKIVKIMVRSYLNSVLLFALRETEVMIETLCYALEYKLVLGQEELQVVSALMSTPGGSERYEQLCEQQMVMRQKGGPEQFTLPPRSTDEDLQKFLKSGSCGNLKSLNLSFTHVSCKSADLISRLPALLHLNLWSSNMQDLGLRRLCESLNLKSLNLCEAPVTDEGIVCLKDMTNLTDLNLNSTKVTDSVYHELRQYLPKLVHCDITYTEADGYEVNEPPEVQNNASWTTAAEVQQKKVDYKQNI